MALVGVEKVKDIVNWPWKFKVYDLNQLKNIPAMRQPFVTRQTQKHTCCGKAILAKFTHLTPLRNEKKREKKKGNKDNLFISLLVTEGSDKICTCLASQKSKCKRAWHAKGQTCWAFVAWFWMMECCWTWTAYAQLLSGTKPLVEEPGLVLTDCFLS